MKTLSEQLFNLDQMVIEGEEPPSEYFSERQSKLALKAAAFDLFSELLSLKQDAYLAKIEQLKLDNNSVSTSIEAAAAMATVSMIYLETMANGGLGNLTDTIEVSLREIAERCPQRYGAAVGRAQSILSHYGKPFTPTDECKGEKKSVDGKSADFDFEKSNDVINVEDVLVYPNPASDFLSIRISSVTELSWSIDLFDAKGVLILSEFSQGNKILLDIADFPAGVYWIRAQSERSSISKRIIIN
jgi:hypothetical protein